MAAVVVVADDDDGSEVDEEKEGSLMAEVAEEEGSAGVVDGGERSLGFNPKEKESLTLLPSSVAGRRSP
jgi:hypothetical protein